jgi:hypothetical protein
LLSAFRPTIPFGDGAVASALPPHDRSAVDVIVGSDARGGQ